MVSQPIHPQAVSVVTQAVTLAPRQMLTRVSPVNHQLLISFKIRRVLMNALLSILLIYQTHVNNALVPALLAHLRLFAKLVYQEDCFLGRNALQHALLPTLP